MKNIIRKITLLIIIGFFNVTTNASVKTPDTASCLQLSGKILKLKRYSSNTYTINLVRDNEIIETKVIKGNNEFKLNLQKNGWYTVKISKQGYVCRVISVDTKLASENNGHYKFAFDTELIEEEDALRLNKSALKMPIAHISFDAKKRWFTHSVAYTNQVKNKIYSGHLQLNK